MPDDLRERLASNQNNQTATQELLQRLRQQEPSSEKWARVAAAAADVWGGGGGMFSKMYQAQLDSKEAERKQILEIEKFQYKQKKDSLDRALKLMTLQSKQTGTTVQIPEIMRKRYRELGVLDEEMDIIQMNPKTITSSLSTLIKSKAPSTKDQERLSMIDSNVEELANVFSRSLENPEWLGLKGYVPSIAQHVGLINPQEGAFRADVGRVFDLYRKNITGAQASYQEIQYLKKNVPTVTDTPELFRAKAQRFMAMYGRIRRNIIERHQRSGKYIAPNQRVDTILENFQASPEMESIPTIGDPEAISWADVKTGKVKVTDTGDIKSGKATKKEGVDFDNMSEEELIKYIGE